MLKAFFRKLGVYTLYHNTLIIRTLHEIRDRLLMYSRLTAPPPPPHMYYILYQNCFFSLQQKSKHCCVVTDSALNLKLLELLVFTETKLSLTHYSLLSITFWIHVVVTRGWSLSCWWFVTFRVTFTFWVRLRKSILQTCRTYMSVVSMVRIMGT